MAKSSTETEYRALAIATCELQWLVYLFEDLKITYIKTPTIYCDNGSTLHIAANPVFHERTKHLDIDCHIVIAKANNGTMKLLLVSSTDQIADFFTKGLYPSHFSSFKSMLGLLDVYHPSTFGALLG